MDSATWAALAFLLTAAGAGWTYVAYQRRGLAAGVRGAAWTLVPVAAWLTGTLELAGDVVDDVTRWAAHLVFSPAVWLGILVAGMSVVLFGVSARLASREERRAGKGTKPADRVQPTRRPQVSPAERDGDALLDDDVSAILRKHGIS